MGGVLRDFVECWVYSQSNRVIIQFLARDLEIRALLIKRHASALVMKLTHRNRRPSQRDPRATSGMETRSAERQTLISRDLMIASLCLTSVWKGSALTWVSRPVLLTYLNTTEMGRNIDDPTDRTVQEGAIRHVCLKR